MRPALFAFIAIVLILSSASANQEAPVAKKVNTLKIVDEPKGCYKAGDYPCAVKSLQRNQIQQEEVTLNLNRNSILVFYSMKHFRLLEGLFYFKGLNKNKIETNQVQFNANGELMISVSAARSEVFNINSEMVWTEKTQPLSSPPVGFQNWYGYSNTRFSEGVIEPIQWVKFIKLWAPFIGNEVEAKKNISFFKEIWAGNTQQASEYYLSVTKRKIASEERNQEERRKRIIENKEENERLRKLFRSRSTGADFF